MLLLISKGRLQWLRRVERMPKERTVKEVFKYIPLGKGPWESQATDLGRGRPVVFKVQF
jgi:hypothetical protein